MLRRFRLTLRHWWLQTAALRLAWWMPKTIAMWCFYRIMTELDPDAGTRLVKPVDIVGDWARYHRLH